MNWLSLMNNLKNLTTLVLRCPFWYHCEHILFNSTKLPDLVDWCWSTACSWCSLLCYLLVNPWASEILFSREVTRYILIFKHWHLYVTLWEMSNLCYFPIFICVDQEKYSFPGGWWCQGYQYPGGKLHWWFCRREHCSCSYMSLGCF